MSTQKKTFILDTNVLLHEPDAILKLSEDNKNSLVIPIIVLEELDRLKIGSATINYNARHFIRMLEKNEIDIHIDINKYTFPDDIPVEANKPDNIILACAYHNKTATLVTKDINLRMKARALSIKAVDFVSDKFTYSKYTGAIDVVTSEEMIEQIYESKNIKNTFNDTFVNNQYVKFKSEVNNKHTALSKYDKESDSFTLLNIKNTFGISSKNVEQAYTLDALLDVNIPLVALTGLSGSGKTLLSLASALQARKDYRQIYITRQTVPVGNDIGFLPGTALEKIRPYLEPFYDNLKYLKSLSQGNKEAINKMMEGDNPKIEVAPITYIRGRSIPNVFFIIDEAQNLTPTEIKTIITRAGEGTKIVLLGDIDQIDAPYLDRNSNGLTYVINKFKDNKLFAYVNLQRGERSALAEEASKIL